MTRRTGDQAELGEAVASKIIAGAKKMANVGGFVSGVSLLERHSEVQKLVSGAVLSTNSSEELRNRQLSGFRKFGSGKTQIGHQLAVNTILPIAQGGW